MLSTERIIKSWQDGVCVMNSDLEFYQYNTQFTQVFELLFGINFTEISTLIDLQITDISIYQILRFWLEEAKKTEYFSTTIDIDGGFVDVRCIYYAIENCYLIYFQDSTERVQNEIQHRVAMERLQRRNELYKKQEARTEAILKAMPIGLMQLTLTDEGKIIDVNSQFTYLTSYDNHSIRQVQKLYNLVYEKDKEKVHNYITSKIRGEHTKHEIKCRLVTKNEDLLWVKLCIAHTELPEFPSLENFDKRLILAFLTDITELQNDRDALAKRNKQIIKWGLSFAMVVVTIFSSINLIYERMVVNDIIHTYNETLRDQANDNDRRLYTIFLYMAKRTLQSWDDSKTYRQLDKHSVRELVRLQDSVNYVLEKAEPDNLIWLFQTNFWDSEFLQYRTSKEMYSRYDDTGQDSLQSPRKFSYFDSLLNENQ